MHKRFNAKLVRYGGNTTEKNNGDVVFKRISTDKLEIGWYSISPEILGQMKNCFTSLIGSIDRTN
jgi:hypothetical protein